MSRRRKPVEKPAPEARRAQLVAHAAGHTLQSHAVGALPLINGILERLKLEECLEQVLPEEDQRVVVPAATGLSVLLKNILLSREPLYGVADWGIRQAPDLLGLTTTQIHAFNDDRMVLPGSLVRFRLRQRGPARGCGCDPRVSGLARRTAQRFDHGDVPRRLRRCERGTTRARPPGTGHHLGTQ